MADVSFLEGVLTARKRAARRGAVAAALATASCLVLAEARAAYRLAAPPRPPAIATLLGPRLTSTLDWWSQGVVSGRSFRLDPVQILSDSMRPFRVACMPSATPLSTPVRWTSELYWHVDVNEIPPLDEPAATNRFPVDALTNDLDPFVPNLAPSEPLALDASEDLGAWLQAPKPVAMPIAARADCPKWRAPRAITFTGLGGEGDRIALVDCEGVVSADAIDRLSALGRQPGTPRPALPLPMSPTDDPAVAGEWVEGVRLLHPRLLGVIERIAAAFPGRAIALYSGYRRDARLSSPHRRGRAVDMAISGVNNDRLFAFCRTLKDLGCGYYPNQPFVHVDVRDAWQGAVAWIDIARPGQVSNYAAIWPSAGGDVPAAD